MKHIGNLRYAEGSKHKKKRIGRGPGSGMGGTATRGHKGQQSRKSYNVKRGFEGGQMPMNRRLPKFGFFNRFRVEYQVVNLDRIQKLVEDNRLTDNKLDYDSYYKLGLVSKKNLPVKILGDGELNAAVTIEANKFSTSAKQKIESAGGTVIIHE